jgi:hypothetical protein
MQPCVLCARNVDGDWNYCPSCGSNQSLRKSLLALLSRRQQPCKARELTLLLRSVVSPGIKKSDINRLLYRLLSTGIGTKDLSFRWSLSKPVAEVISPCILPSPTVPAEAVSPDPSVNIEHWVFSLGSEAETQQRIWCFRCDLCGERIKKVFSGTYAYWLWSRLRTRRRNHDREFHPETITEQETAEEARFKPHSDNVTPRFASIRHSKQPNSRPRVDELMKASLAHRLREGFSLLRGKR